MNTRNIRWASCDDCGVFAVSKVWKDGSFEHIVSPCWHFSSQCPPKSKIKEAFFIAAAQGKGE